MKNKKPKNQEKKVKWDKEGLNRLYYNIGIYLNIGTHLTDIYRSSDIALFDRYQKNIGYRYKALKNVLRLT